MGVKGNKGNTKKKTLFREGYCEQAENYAFLGVTDAQLGQFFKVTERTIRTWRKNFPQFLSSLKKGKEDADAQVAKSLFKRAIGYTFEEERKEYKDAKLVGIVKTTKHVPAETVACIYWLNNRQPDRWKNRWEPNENNKAITVKIIEDGDND